MKYTTILFIILFAYGLLPAQPGTFDAKEEHSYVQKNRIESVKIYQVERDMATDNIHNRQLTSVRYFDENGHLREVHRFEEDG
ncbi:hypothetical protein RZS08_40730, partial [Arthrospira platensis SPKY1]|nr:hypothetical protein [Arthrospira platensis SPKY1]